MRWRRACFSNRVVGQPINGISQSIASLFYSVTAGITSLIHHKTKDLRIAKMHNNLCSFVWNQFEWYLSPWLDWCIYIFLIQSNGKSLKIQNKKTKNGEKYNQKPLLQRVFHLVFRSSEIEYAGCWNQRWINKMTRYEWNKKQVYRDIIEKISFPSNKKFT